MTKSNTIDNTVREAAKVCACFHLRRATRAVTQLFDNTLQSSGLRSTQFVILAAIHDNAGPRLPDLAEALNVDRSTLTRNLQPLERDGLLKVVPGKTSRAYTVRLTAKGRRFLARTIPLWEEAQSRFVKQFGARRWKSMLKDLHAIVDAAHDA